ncbi:nuclease-related domain-containing protein [Lederbergia panacisoli]|uniref:nuclease-related domain-containing protein n=1 Tax=Lederbergia panacisoli TaxID=1255251 RepID=UPI00214ADFC3|nr:nuclease-related domain-containing protein [Lederbergia panacisoli]MCR2823105.1 NERD domain-containing protein [Lederbergia panacisoli]
MRKEVERKIKQRIESRELKMYRSLKSRSVLSTDDAAHLARLEKGYKGELLFDERLGKISNNWLVLNDLQLESNNNDFQIDSLLIAHRPAILFEIKNYGGDYYIEGDKWFYSNGSDIQNPVSQLERSEILLRRLLRDMGYNIPVESYLVFINPEFHLYNAPRNLPIIYPTQLNRFFDKLSKMQTNVSESHMKLARKIISQHKKDFPLKNVPKYSYAKIRKGVMCASCCSFNVVSNRSFVVCKDCGSFEKTEIAILRSVDEFRLLFPEKKITTSRIFEWTNGIKTTETIQKILLKEFIQIGSTKSSYYVKKS